MSISRRWASRVHFEVDNRWFSGAAEISSFELEELLGTKLRALYQRKKGRDLFDLWYALDTVDADKLLACFARYMRGGGGAVTRAQFEANLHAKRTDASFRADVEAMLRPGVDWDFDAALNTVLDRLVARIPGEPWKGT